jgi:hypothetical protein
MLANNNLKDLFGLMTSNLQERVDRAALGITVAPSLLATADDVIE